MPSTEGDETQKERKEKQLMKAKKRALSSSIMADIREELDQDRPSEIRVCSGSTSDQLILAVIKRILYRMIIMSLWS
jgi:hypothetical protein